MKSLKKKSVLILTLVLSLLIGFFGCLMLLNKKDRVFAADDIKPTVSKINLYLNENVYYAFYYGKTKDDTIIDGRAYYLYNEERNVYEKVIDTYTSDIENYYVIYAEKIELDDELRFTNQSSNPFLNGTINKNNQYKVLSQDIKDDDDIFMIKNANLEDLTLSGNEVVLSNNQTLTTLTGNFTQHEFILVQFKTPSISSKLLSLSVNIKLNDEINISPLDVTTTDELADYSQLFNLTNSNILDTSRADGNGEKLDGFEAQGKYDFTFTYNISQNGVVETNRTSSTSFYLLSENYYINPNYHDTEDEPPFARDNVSNLSEASNYNKVFNNNRDSNSRYTEPRLYNTERIDKGYYDGTYNGVYDGSLKSEQNYFNFNNYETVDYDGEPTDMTQDQYIKYPTITYDASRYNLSYTKTMYGITTFVSTKLDTTGDEPKLMFYYESPSSNWTETLYVEQEDNGQCIASVEFNEIGKYVLSFNFVLDGQILSYDEQQKLFVEKENWNLIHSYELSIFGYQLMHSEYKNETGATEKEIKDVNFRIYADVTNINSQADNFVGKVNLIDDNDDFYISNYLNLYHDSNNTLNFASTNQAPLFFRYFASLSGNLNDSYYLFFTKNNNYFISETETINNKTSAVKHELTSNTRFTENGLYVVCLNYNYADYSYIDNNEIKTNKDHTQIFFFEIENIEPKVNFYKDNYIEINSDPVQLNPFNTYELKNGVYELTTDTQYNPNKIYYKKDDLLTGGYTKYSVEINWQDALLSPFDVTPNVIVYRNNFGDDDLRNADIITNQINQNDLLSGKINVSNNGIYTVKIEYGPCNYAYDAKEKTYKWIYSASVTSTFIIDKEEIGEGENVIRFYENSSANLNERIIADNTLLTNKSFAIAYGTIESSSNNQIVTTATKRSGAKIYVSYSFMPINVTQQNSSMPLNNGMIIPNGATITSKNDNIAYSSTIIEQYFDNSSNILTNDGIYIFTFEDEAGHSTTRYITKDTTSPVLFQYIDNESANKYSLIPSSSSHIDNMVNIDTQIIWGASKAIKIEQNDVIDQLKNAGYDIQEYNSNNYLLIGIDGYNKINKSNIPLSIYELNDKPYTSGITIYYLDEGNNVYTANSTFNISTDYSYTLKAKNGEEEILENEHLFRIKLYDVLGNSFEGIVEMTFDKSLLQAHVSGIPSNNVQIISSNSNFESNGNGAQERLNLYSVSNKQSISFSWIAGGEDFSVTEVQCEFYPLTFELLDSNGNLNSNYPYSASYLEKFNLMNDTTPEVVTSSINGIAVQTNRTKTSIINSKQNSRFNDEASVQGMYKIIRTYRIGENIQQEKYDTKEYIFYIDRNNIISFDEKIAGKNENDGYIGGYIGNDIKALFGDGTDIYSFQGGDFLQQFITDYIFLTNRQPGTLNIPVEKYSYQNVNDQFTSLNSKIGVNYLSLKVYRNGNRFQENTRISDQDLKNNTNYFVDVDDYSRDGITYYEIVIADNAGSSLVFNVAVNLFAPQANFVDNANNTILTESQNNYISKNNTDMSLVWEVDETGINAKIDENDITITQIFENGRKIVLYSGQNNINLPNIQNLVKINGNTRSINFDDFKTVINRNIGNCKIEVQLKYLTSSPLLYGEYLSSTKVIYFDYEKPQLNFTELFEKDQYLTNLNVTKAEFEDYNSAINFENYTFVVENNFTLSTPERSNFWQKDLPISVTTNPNDLEMVWYRKYNKYADDTGINQQSLVPGDERYNKTEDAPTRLNFNPNLYITVLDDNGNEIVVKAYEQILTNLSQFTFPEPGYYEVIEKDCADNYRIYTILVLSEGDKNIEYTETTDSVDGQPIEIPNFFKINNENNTTYFEVSNQKVHIDNFENLGDWFAIDVLNGSNNTKLLETLYVSPLNLPNYLTLNQALAEVNNAIVDDEHTGKYFVININSSQYSKISINFRTPGEKYELDANLTATSLIVTIDPNRYNGTYLKTLQVYEVDDNGTREQLYYDSNDEKINPNNEFTPLDDVVRYVFSYNVQKVRNLWFEYTDNFGVSYKENFILGITQTPFEEMLTFNNSYIKNNNFTPIKIDDISSFDKYAEYYSSSQVELRYQPKIYSKLRIFLKNSDGIFENITEEVRFDTSNRNVTKLPEIFQSSNEEGMADAHYIIIFEDTSGKIYQFSLHHYTKIAELHFIDDNNYEHYFDIGNNLYEFSVSRVVYLSYEKYDIETSYPIQTSVSVTRSYRDGNNVTLVHDYGIVDNEFLFNQYGVYTVVATNQLGASKIYQFEYIKSDAIYYSVKANANGTTLFLSPSPVKYQFGNDDLDQYVSIYPVTVDVNQEKNLKVEEVYSTLETKIYHIYSMNSNVLQYDTKIAVTTIDRTSNILNGYGTITEIVNTNGTNTSTSNAISAKYIKSNANKIILSLPSYYNYPDTNKRANLIKVRIVYEDKDLGVVNEYDGNNNISIELTTAGQYKIYMYDLAGNQQSFDGTEYLEIVLMNNFLYTLNGERGIFNSVYNEEVKLLVEQRSNFVTDSNGNAYTINCTLNGNSYSPSYSNGSYVFNSYGTYNVTLKGYLNKDISGNLINEVETKIKFTILNPNEARLMHEYIGLNGYEVTKIVKNNTDVTSDIKEQLNVASINKFAISGIEGGIGGSGIYEITVSAIIDKIIGESEFTYSVWINDDSEILIIPSIAEGSSTTKNITLQLNYFQIYSKVGECQLKVNGNVIADINSTTATNSTSTLTLSSNTRYNVTLETLGGNTISSFVVTKVEPLNTIAIIIIVITSVVVAGLTVTFILFRKRMRVR